MRAYELVEVRQNTGFKLFVDLDGVLVNFEKGVSEFMADDSWGEKHTVHGYAMGNSKQSNVFWRKIKYVNNIAPNEAVSLWSNLEWMSDGKKLWSYIAQYNPIILSSPGTESRLIIEAGKTRWIRKNLKPEPSYIFEPDKWKHAAGKPGIQNILIDDSAHKLNPWMEHDGIGILHTSAADTIKQLKKWNF